MVEELKRQMSNFFPLVEEGFASIETAAPLTPHLDQGMSLFSPFDVTFGEPLRDAETRAARLKMGPRQSPLASKLESTAASSETLETNALVSHLGSKPRPQNTVSSMQRKAFPAGLAQLRDPFDPFDNAQFVQGNTRQNGFDQKAPGAHDPSHPPRETFPKRENLLDLKGLELNRLKGPFEPIGTLDSDLAFQQKRLLDTEIPFEIKSNGLFKALNGPSRKKSFETEPFGQQFESSLDTNPFKPEVFPLRSSTLADPLLSGPKTDAARNDELEINLDRQLERQLEEQLDEQFDKPAEGQFEHKKANELTLSNHLAQPSFLSSFLAVLALTPFLALILSPHSFSLNMFQSPVPGPLAERVDLSQQLDHLHLAFEALDGLPLRSIWSTPRLEKTDKAIDTPRKNIYSERVHKPIFVPEREDKARERKGEKGKERERERARERESEPAESNSKKGDARKGDKQPKRNKRTLSVISTTTTTRMATPSVSSTCSPRSVFCTSFVSSTPSTYCIPSTTSSAASSTATLSASSAEAPSSATSSSSSFSSSSSSFSSSSTSTSTLTPTPSSKILSAGKALAKAVATEHPIVVNFSGCRPAISDVPLHSDCSRVVLARLQTKDRPENYCSTFYRRNRHGYMFIRETSNALKVNSNGPKSWVTLRVRMGREAHKVKVDVRRLPVWKPINLNPPAGRSRKKARQ